LRWLKKNEINTVLDVGANEGQFALFINKLFPNASVYSFEPIELCYKKLKKLSQSFANIVPFQFALGNVNDRIRFYKNEFTPSSSILKMMEKHRINFPFARKQVIEFINVKRLDDIIETLEIRNNVMVKIDVQGYEDRVIQGGINFLKINTKILIVETSLIKLYLEEPSFNDIYELLFDIGFVFIGILNQLYSPIDGEILQADAIFINKLLK
jgi:FkbM family methyltransferase